MDVDPEIRRPLGIAPDYLQGRRVSITLGIGALEKIVDPEARDKALDLGGG